MQEAPVLRPLSVGDIIDRTLRLIRANVVLFVGIVVIPDLIIEVLQRASGLSQTFDPNDFVRLFDPTRSGAVAPRAFPAVNGGLIAVVGILSGILAIAQYGALNVAIAQRYLGKAITVREAYERGLRAAPALFFSVLAIVILFVVVFAVFAVMLVVFNTSALAAIAVIVGLIAFFFVGPWFFLSLAVIGPVIVVERLGPIAAIRRSFHLMDKARLRALGLYILVWIIAIIIGVVFGLIFVVSFVTDPTVRTVLQVVASVASATISGPLIYGTLVLLYYDLRVRKEALDLQLAAEALPRDV